ncbi:C4-dicarboxylate TRAP transporter large permease protein DctM [Caprobacter fermentans]|uniref:TRAP transporter large permease n=1 Tax=Caproicibacter fermentans TaxID=2576756 RepID=A0A6N8HZG1_9FIRM|nr:TRAP transporter large permease [Caproicibacter fermentans]MVB11221.1 C4-dicarboxylate TRAP transporter large permease protein DctM [Caproicibacter fermentans]QNK41968.1 TRAP transporter large permease [Caproicibacter fermentans]
MNLNFAIALLLISFVIFIICKMPVAIALASSTAITMLYLQIPVMTLVQQMSKSIDSFSLMAIPFFIFAGELMGAGGISDRLLKFANVIVGRLRGGLAHVNVLASMFFGGISGSAVADVSSLGCIEIPMMTDAGYDEDFSVAVTVTSACQGVLIPPSHNMIIYSLAAGGVSIGALFMGGVIPGILLGVCLMIVCGIISVKRQYPKGERVKLRDALKITRDAILALGTIIIIMGGVVSGIFTATESAAFACIYAFIISVFFYRELKVREIPRLLMNTIRTLAVVFSLIASAGAFGWLLAYLQVPMLISNFLLSVTTNRVIVFLLINLMLLVLGCFMDMAPLILIVTPILLPVVEQYGMNPVQFGVMLILNLAIGLCTPPVGGALFVGCSIGKISVEKVTVAMLPMYAAMLIALMLVTFIPAISLWIPGLL